MTKVLAKHSQWSQHFGLNFTMNQAPISFFTRLVKKTLKDEIYRSRPGTVDRQYHYQVMTVELIDEQLADFGVVPQSLEERLARETVQAEMDSLDCGADDDKRVSELLVMRDRVVVRGFLLDAAMARYSGLTSKLYLNGDSINGSVDVVVDGGGDRTAME